MSGGPGGLSLVNRTTNTISISWAAGAGGTPTCYNVYRDGTKVGDCVSNAGPFQDTSLNANQSYSYTVSAMFGSDESVQSSALTESTLAEAPTSFSVSNITNGSSPVSLSWSDNLNAGSPEYRIYKDNVLESTVSTLSSTVAVSSNTEYDFKVCTHINSDNAEYCTSTATIRTIATTTDIQTYNIGGGNTCAGCHGLSNNDLEVKARGANTCYGIDAPTLVTCYSGVMGVTISTETSEILHNWFLDIE